MQRYLDPTLFPNDLIAPRQAAVERGKKQSAQILHQPARRHAVAKLCAVQVDDEQFQGVARPSHPPVAVLHQKVAKVKIAVVHAALVQRAGEGRDFFEQRALEQYLVRAGQAASVEDECFQRDHAFKGGGDDEGFQRGRRVRGNCRGLPARRRRDRSCAR